MKPWDYEGARLAGVGQTGERSAGLDLARVARCEVGRFRARARRGETDLALAALDRALRAIAALDAACAREPWLAPAGADLRAELDRLTR